MWCCRRRAQCRSPRARSLSIVRPIDTLLAGASSPMPWPIPHSKRVSAHDLSRFTIVDGIQSIERTNERTNGTVSLMLGVGGVAPTRRWLLAVDEAPLPAWVSQWAKQITHVPPKQVLAPKASALTIGRRQVDPMDTMEFDAPVPAATSSDRAPDSPLALASTWSSSSLLPQIFQSRQQLSPRSVEAAANRAQLKAGYLIKRGGRVKNLKRRYFVLYESELVYYRSDKVARLACRAASHRRRGCSIERLDGLHANARSPSPL